MLKTTKKKHDLVERLPGLLGDVPGAARMPPDHR
jgi:hypothetical protein